MRHGSDRELPILVTLNLHDQENQYANDLLAVIELAIHYVDIASDGPGCHEVNLCDT